MGLAEFIEYLKREAGVLKGAPLSFTGLLVVGFGSGFLSGKAWNSQELANIRSKIEVLEERLNFKTDQLDDVNRKLSESQVSALETELKKSPSTIAVIEGLPFKPKSQLGIQFQEAFSDSGWQVETRQLNGPGVCEVDDAALKRMLGEGEGVALRAPNSEVAATLQQALQDAKIKYQALEPSNSCTPGFFVRGE